MNRAGIQEDCTIEELSRLLVLASASPRRKVLLEMVGIKNMVITPSDCEEKEYPDKSIAERVCLTARDKAINVSQKYGDDDVIIAADTMVLLDGDPMGKPKNEEDAKKMLNSLSGNKHEVYTGVVVKKGKTIIIKSEKTDVYFRKLTEKEITDYIKSGEPMDKAGAYGVQGKAAVFVNRIVGDYFNVVGLPLCLLGEMLKEIGYSI